MLGRKAKVTDLVYRCRNRVQLLHSEPRCEIRHYVTRVPRAKAREKLERIM